MVLDTVSGSFDAGGGARGVSSLLPTELRGVPLKFLFFLFKCVYCDYVYQMCVVPIEARRGHPGPLELD